MGPEIMLLDTFGRNFSNIRLNELDEYPSSVEIDGSVYLLIDRGNGPILATYQLRRRTETCPHCNGILGEMAPIVPDMILANPEFLPAREQV